MKLTMYGVGDCAPYRNDLDSSFRHVTETFRNARSDFRTVGSGSKPSGNAVFLYAYALFLTAGSR